MSDIERLDAAALAALRDARTRESRLARGLALLEPTKKLARMLGGYGASLIETNLSSIGKPQGLSAHCSRETRLAQEIREQGDSRHATPALSR